jgi:hypothetical protein
MGPGTALTAMLSTLPEVPRMLRAILKSLVVVTVNPPSVYVAIGVPFAPTKPEKVMVVADAAAEASVPPARMIAAGGLLFSMGHAPKSSFSQSSFGTILQSIIFGTAVLTKVALFLP